MRHYAAAAAIFMLSGSAAFADMPCEAFTRQTIKDVVGVFHDTAHNVTQKRADLTKLFQSTVDTNWIGKFVLGRFWNEATDEEKQQYLTAYRAYVTNSYISRFDDEDGFGIADIQIDSIAAGSEPNQIQAKTTVKSKAPDDADVHVVYTLDATGGKCQVHDITVEGVSLLVSQRSEFQSLAGNAGVKGVIAALNKKINPAK